MGDNLIKLTPLEKRVLIAVATPVKKESNYFYEGYNTEGIASQVYGDEVLNDYYHNLSICPAAKSTLSRTLKSLFNKGMVKKCKPHYRYRWGRYGDDEPDGPDYNFPCKDLEHLDARYKKDDKIIDETIRVPTFTSLPKRTHVWWMITDKGAAYLEKS
jgi:hypothetical protein